MNKQIRRYLSAIIAMALMFTNAFSNVVLAEEETVGIEDISADENTDFGGDFEDGAADGKTDETTEDIQNDKDTENIIEDGALNLAAVTYDDTDINLAAVATTYDEFVKKFDEAQGGTPVTESKEYKYDFTTLSYGTDNYFKSNAEETGTEEAGIMWVDANSGSIRKNGDNSQIGTGVKLYIPVNGKTTFTFRTYGGNYGEGHFEITDPAGDYSNYPYKTTGKGDETDQFVYWGKSKTVIELNVVGAGSSGFYLYDITAVSEGVQDGPIPVTWEKRDFELNINGTNVTVEGAESQGGSANITIDDADATVVSAGATEASIKLNLGGKALAADMISTTTEDIATNVEGNNVTVSFTGKTIEPLTYTIKVADYSTEIKNLDDYIAKRTPVDINKTYTYTIQRTTDDAEKATVSTGSAKELGGIWIDCTAGSVTDNGKSNGVSVKSGAEFYIPVNGESTITFKGLYNKAAFNVTDLANDSTSKEETLNPDNAASWGTYSFKYTGKSETVIKLAMTSNFYLKEIEVVSEGVKETPTWEKRDFNLNIKGTNITVAGAENDIGSANISIDDAEATVVSAKAKEASLKINLGGEVLSAEMVTTTTEGITTSVEGNNVVVSFKGATIEPLTYTIKVADYSTEIRSAEQFAEQFDETKGGTPVAVNEDKIYTLEKENENEETIAFKGAEGVAKGVYIDAAKGEFSNNGRVGNGAIVKAGTIIYVPVNGTTSFAFSTGYNTANVSVSDSLGFSDGFEIASPSDWLTKEYEYNGKSATVVKFEITSGSLYLRSITANSKGVQEGPPPVTWEKRDFSIKINGTTVDVVGAENAGSSSSVTLSDENATVILAKAKEAALKINLEGKALTADIVEVVSGDITTSVENDKVIVSFTGKTIEPLTYTISVADYSGEIKSLEDYKAQFDETKGGTPVVVGEEKTYTLEVTDASKGATFEGSAQEVAGIWVDATNGKFDNAAANRLGNGAQLNGGTVIYIPVNGKSTITFSTGYNNALVEVADDLEYEDSFSIAQGGWGTDTYEYVGKSKTVVKLTLKGQLYIKNIKVTSEGVQEGDVKTWEKRDFSFKINGVPVNVTGAAKKAESAVIDPTNITVVSASSTDAYLRLDLGGKELTKELITELTEGAEANIVDGNVVISFVGATVEPKTFTFKMVDSSIIKEPVAGETYTYDFTKGIVLPASIGKVDTFVTDDGLMTINGGGKVYMHDATHGIAMGDGNSFEIKVAGDASVSFGCCTYGSAKTMTAAVKDGNGVVTPMSDDISGSSNNGIRGEGEAVIFSYKGEPTTLVFTVGAAGEGYLHSITVQNVKTNLDIENNGKIDVWDFGAYQMDSEKYNNLLNADVINGWYNGVAAGTAGVNFVETFTTGNLSWSGKANNRLRTTNEALTRTDEGTSVTSIKGFDSEALNINGCIYVNSSSGGGSFALDLLKDDVVYVYVKMDNGDDFITFTKVGNTSPSASVKASIDGSIVKFVAPETGTYMITDTTEAGKARYYRITREHAEYVTLKGVIDVPKNITSDYEVIIRNFETKAEVTAQIGEDGNYSAELSAGYDYEIRLDNAKGFRISKGNKVSIDGSSKEVTNNIEVVPVNYITYSGTLSGFDAEYDISNAEFYYEPVDNDDKLSYGNAEFVVDENGKYTVKLAENITYRLVMKNVNDYESVLGKEITAKSDRKDLSGIECKYGDINGDGYITAADVALVLSYTLSQEKEGLFSDKQLKAAEVDGTYPITVNDASAILQNVLNSKNELPVVVSGGVISGGDVVNSDIGVATKKVYNVTGNFVTSDGGTVNVSGLTFTRLDDGYVYNAEVAGSGYSIKLRDGDYEISASAGDSYKSSSHIAVKGADVVKDIYFLSTNKVTVPYAKDVYVDNEAGDYHYATLKEAIDAVNNMDKTPSSEAERITIHIAPGTYRAQYSLTMPYVSLVNNDPSQKVLVTWYYGIGYKYYSADSSGLYNPVNAADKYLKNGKSTPSTSDVKQWGASFFIQATATDFRAENIYFENSFNKYITQEEIDDGVEPNLAQSIRFDRTNLNADVKSKAATERAAAMVSLADRAEFYNCTFSSSQDTLYMGGGTHQYYNNCFIEGMTDYIFGDGEIVFDKCTLNFCGYSDSTIGGYITATRVEQGGEGYLFKDCDITRNSSDGIKVGTGYLGRPWNQNATVKFINTQIENKKADKSKPEDSEDLINKRGWSDWDEGVTADKANYYQYNMTYGDNEWKMDKGTELTQEEADAVNMTDYFGGWTPAHYGE